MVEEGGNDSFVLSAGNAEQYQKSKLQLKKQKPSLF